MRRTIVIATAAAAVLSAGLLAGPALAAVGQTNGPGRGAGTGAGTGNCSQDGSRPGMGSGSRPGMGSAMGSGTDGRMAHGLAGGTGDGTGRRGTGSADPLAGLAQGSLTTGQRTALAGMAEEEKLAHDVYVALARTSGDVRFTRIAAAEARHLAEVRALLARYGVADPTAGRADGVFASAAVQQRYRDLVARGDDSAAAALAVGRDVEKADLAALAAAGAGVTAPDVSAVYARLTAGSQRHLQAFTG